ncbi:MAG: CfrBI family restriction endonuclease [Helicobacteraceae bacterium]|jgi:hypothetical protein|nr:CfrBI family restriction endonuclease [Helicobacteraceae bacterium]
MSLANQIVKDVIYRVIKGEDYRVVIVNSINAEFLQFSIDFFKRIVAAKLKSKNISIDWYKKAFISNPLSSDEIAINAGINKKTITNMRGLATKSIVIDAANEHFDYLYDTILNLVKSSNDIELTLTIRFNGVSVDLSVSESLVVINTLAVKRAQLKGGLWSAIGKSAEKYIVLALCKLYGVSDQYYDASRFVKDKQKAVDREIDFYLLSNKKKYRCEIKLMGKGNPESTDAIIARGSKVFVADTFSLQNKSQCGELGVYWVALRDKNGFRRFKTILKTLNIPHNDYLGNLDIDLPPILDELFAKKGIASINKNSAK